jgi:hypothetical protein
MKMKMETMEMKVIMTTIQMIKKETMEMKKEMKEMMEMNKM